MLIWSFWIQILKLTLSIQNLKYPDLLCKILNTSSHSIFQLASLQLRILIYMEQSTDRSWWFDDLRTHHSKTQPSNADIHYFFLFFNQHITVFRNNLNIKPIALFPAAMVVWYIIPSHGMHSTHVLLAISFFIFHV